MTWAELVEAADTPPPAGLADFCPLELTDSLGPGRPCGFECLTTMAEPERIGLKLRVHRCWSRTVVWHASWGGPVAAREEIGGAAEAQGRMLRVLREAVARAGGTRRISGLSLVAILCASVVAPVGLVGLTIGPVLSAWLAAAGSVGSNLLADVITNAVGRREPAEDVAGQLQEAVAAELETRMSGTSSEAAGLRRAVATLLREHNAEEVLVEALTEGDDMLQAALAESVTLLAGRFEEFSGLLAAVRDGVWDLQEAVLGQRAENQAQAEHRDHVQVALDRILQLLESGSLLVGEAGVVYNALPPDTGAFTGRQAEIREITGQMTTAAAHGGVVAIHAIDGMPGVGKSALAVHVAHLLADRFPDRQLFVDLHAHTVGRAPADPAVTLASLLSGDGLDPRQLPTGLEELSALWRARMARRRTLLVLDNAASSSQVAPLLPGGHHTLVLVTSRRHLGDLPYAVTEISLDVLPLKEAMTVFLRLAPRAAAEGEHQEKLLAQVVALAGYLPLAISLLARVYTKLRTWSMSDLIEETRARMLTLSAEYQTVSAAFDLSYQALTPFRQRFFRLLSLHPGSDLDPYAAAALTGASLERARDHLEALHGDHLVTEPDYHRYGMHDLIRAHARSQTETHDLAEQRDAALSQLLHYYAHTAQSASVLISRYPRPASDNLRPTRTPDLPDPDSARLWLRTEHPNLDAAFTHAHAHGRDGQVVALAAGLAEILQEDGHWIRALEIHRAAAHAAERLEQPLAHATALNDLGQARYLTGDYLGAIDAHVRGLGISQELDHRFGEATALNFLGEARFAAGDYPGAIDADTRALEICRQLAHRLGEATALNDLGVVRFATGDYLGAIDAHVRALEICREGGHRLGEATALNFLGEARYLTGDYPAAIDAHTRALEICRELDHRLGEANALNHLGVVWLVTGDYPAATDAVTRALTIYQELGHRVGEADALDHLAEVRCSVGDYPAAIDAATRSIGIYRELGHRQGESSALVDLGLARQLIGDYPAAIDAHTRALEICRELGHRNNEASALSYYAATLAATGRHTDALVIYQQALAMNRELNKPDDEAIALEGIGEHHLAIGDTRQSKEYLSQALEIYQRLGMRQGIARVQARMADLAPQ